MLRVKISTVLQQYLSRFINRPPLLFHSLFEERRIFKKFYPLMLEQTRKQFSNKLNPFNLCPRAINFWFLVPPYSAVGIVIRDLGRVTVDWRQQIDPNETVFVTFRILELRTPFPLTLFVMFAAFSLVIADSSYRIIEATRIIYEDKLKKIEDVNSEQEIQKTVSEPKNQTLVKSLDPFMLTPRMSIYFPVYENHTSIGFHAIDFQHVEFSVKQSLEPNETVTSRIRFLDLYTPFPLQVAVMLLSVGLFLTGKICEFVQETHE